MIAGMGRFLVQSGDAPSSTLGESRTILQALIHAARRIPLAADQNISVRTGSMSPTQGSQRLHNSTTARAYLSNKFSGQWDLAQHVVHDLLSGVGCSRIRIIWIPTEHGRSVMDPERLLAMVLTH